jgi:uncharacterized protein YndB with AHSA1/START domain
MTEHSVVHATFSLERTYPAAPARVFAAWAEPAAKAVWFAGPAAEHHLDFQVGGHEAVRGRNDEGDVLTFEAAFCDIVSPARIVYSSTLSVRDTVATVSITTVEISAVGDGTRLVLTEQGTYHKPVPAGWPGRAQAAAGRVVLGIRRPGRMRHPRPARHGGPARRLLPLPAAIPRFPGQRRDAGHAGQVYDLSP